MFLCRKNTGLSRRSGELTTERADHINSYGGNCYGNERDVVEIFNVEEEVGCSEEDLARQLGISRDAVKEAIDTYAVTVTSSMSGNQGCRLSTESDVLTSLNSRTLELFFLDITVLPEVTSTNALLRERLSSGEGTALRRGRRRASAMDKLLFARRHGVYEPVVASRRPLRRACREDHIAAVATCEAIEAVSGSCRD